MTPEEPPKQKLLDRVRAAIRLKHYSHRTEETYVHWIKRYIFYHHQRHPQEMGVPEIEAFLTPLAVVNFVDIARSLHFCNLDRPIRNSEDSRR